MSEPQRAAAPESGIEPLHSDPDVAELLEFDPVPRKVKRPDGWTPDLQREFIRRLAISGSPQQACTEMGKNVTGIEAVYKVPSADSFRAAWDNAVQIGRRAQGLDCGPPHLGPVPGIQRRHAGEGSARGRSGQPDPEPEPEISDEALFDTLDSIARKYIAKVWQERTARLAGNIVAADFYLRQITFIEVTLDLGACQVGLSPDEYLSNLRRDGHGLREIVETPFSRILDERRRQLWEATGEPERPEHPPIRTLIDHGDYSLAARTSATGPTTHPAAGHTPEQWAEMSHEAQLAARRAEMEANAAAQIEWEAKARREYDERRGSDASA